MNKPNRTSILAALWLSAVPMSAIASDTALPDARSLIEGHIEAIGGREAIQTQAESILIGEFSMPSAGVSGDLTIASRANGERVTRVELPGIGEIRTGYSPDLSWSIDPFSGPRLIEGDELHALVERSELAAILRDPEFVTAARTVERTEFNDTPCFRVELTWRSGRTSHDCYAIDSGLMIAMENIETSPMGEFESVTLLDDYKVLEDVRLPTVMTVQSMGQEQILKVEEVRIESPDDALFDLPAPIQTLVADRK